MDVGYEANDMGSNHPQFPLFILFSLILFYTVKLDIIIQQGLMVNISKARKQIGGLIISAKDQSLARW